MKYFLPHDYRIPLDNRKKMHKGIKILTPGSARAVKMFYISQWFFSRKLSAHERDHSREEIKDMLRNDYLKVISWKVAFSLELRN